MVLRVPMELAWGDQTSFRIQAWSNAYTLRLHLKVMSTSPWVDTGICGFLLQCTTGAFCLSCLSQARGDSWRSVQRIRVYLEWSWASGSFAGL